MDRYAKFHSEDGILNGVHRNPPEPLQELLKEKGIKHEESVCGPLRSGDGFVEIKREGHKQDQLGATLEAMRSGAKHIYQAALKNDSLFGYADLLERRPGKSTLGEYLYVPLDMKIAAHPKPTALLQLCAYADMLLEAQGVLPPTLTVITRDGKAHEYRTECFFYYYLNFKKQFLAFQVAFSKDIQPLPLKNCDHRDWSIYAKKILHQRDDVALTARLRQSHIEVLQLAGIGTMTALAQCKKEFIEGIPDATLATLIAQAKLQVQSKGKRPPLHTINAHIPEKRMGLAMLPDSHPKDIFFDMEGYPLLGEHGLEYLYGVSERGKDKYQDFWAYTPAEEGIAFQKFIDWAHARWSKNPGMHIYHYSHYEPSTLKRLMGKYGVGERKIDELLTNQVFVDLYAVVVQGLQIGTYSYGLKAIEGLYYPERDTEVSSGAESAVEFAKWLEFGEPSKPENSESLKRIRDYNRDDCWSTRDLEAFLQKAKKDARLHYIPMGEPNREKTEEDPTALKTQCSALAEQLMGSLPMDRRGLPLHETDEASYVCELLAHCLDFYRREAKPEWWDYFRRRDMSREQLAMDSETIVNVRIEGNEGKALLCSFPIDQDIKLREGDKVLILENEHSYESLEILELNVLNGTLTLKGTPKKSPAESFTLSPAKDHIPKDAMQKSLLKLATGFDAKKPHFGLRKCVHDLLLKKMPDVSCRARGEPLLKGKRTPIEEACEVVLAMNDSVLCIQGPPGTGKTFSGSRVIAALLKVGKKVAISSNSHKAINHLLLKAAEVCRDQGIACKALKVASSYSEESEEEFAAAGVDILDRAKAEKVLRSYNLVGATVFALSRETQADCVDYLFIDEATQVALPNLVSMAHCTKNLVLLGDQMQLEQPIKAVHPGSSGNSALVHLTQAKTLVSPDFGLFLATTYRMHPDVCKVVSDTFYESALGSAPETANQRLIWGRANSGAFPETGVRFFPVPHEGNKHGSEEEVEQIERIVSTALKSEWVDEKGKTRPMTPNDILIVAPYNYQVALLQDRLEGKARIGTVDLFQGQEAPLVILSLCASSAGEAPRGLGFLLNKNRVNVAISRAKCVALVVGSPSVWESNPSSIETMELLNTMCRISNPQALLDYGSRPKEADAAPKKRVASKKT